MLLSRRYADLDNSENSAARAPAGWALGATRHHKSVGGEAKKGAANDKLRHRESNEDSTGFHMEPSWFLR